MLKNITLLLSTLLVFSFPLQSQEASANYELAARYSPAKLRKMVFSTRVSPHWLKNSQGFWYTYETTEGKFYYLVNPATRSKVPLFDRVKMAADMSRLTQDPFDAKHLNISRLEFIENETKIRFEVKSKYQEEEEADEEAKRGEEQEEKKKKKKPKMVAKTFHFVYDLGSRQLRLLEDYEKPKEDKNWASIAPNEQYVVFARKHNLYWMDMENYKKALKDEKDSTIVEEALTEDGIEHYSYARGSRGQDNVKVKKDKDKRKPVNIIWSPDSQHFVLTRSDVRKVKDLWVINNTANPRPTLETYKYQMPGEKASPIEELIHFDFANKSKQVIETDTFPDQNISIFSAPRLKKNRDDRRQFRTWLGKTSDKFYFSRISRD
ncbi:MAG: S9 family peptidase, partial [Bacteroidota bacterium]